MKNFRNFKQATIEFSSGVNVISGKNGAGKTSILEALCMIANVKSFRNCSDREIINWDADSYYCATSVHAVEERRFEIGCSIQGNRLAKRIKINGSEITKLADYYGSILTVHFLPDDIKIISGTPEDRRRFFDSMIAKVSPSYVKSMISFKKALLSRNRLLTMFRDRKKIDVSQLETWDHIFAEHAYAIREQRLSFLPRFIESFHQAYLKISDYEVAPRIAYTTTITDNTIEGIKQQLAKTRSTDCSKGITTTGPQREDFYFFNDRKAPFSHYASQGQKRTAVIALKFAEKIFLEEITKKETIILIDDIFSELDAFRREKIIELTAGDNQTIITLVDARILYNTRPARGKEFIVEQGGSVISI